MTPKLLEIRDCGTCIPVLAIRLEPENEAERWLLARSGFGITPDAQREYIAVWKLDGGRDVCTTDPFQHGGGPRTMPTAHQFIEQHFDELESGAVVDVRFLLGETTEPAKSDRLFSMGAAEREEREALVGEGVEVKT